MRTRKVTFTHKGWFGLCPVYLAQLDGDCPEVHERHWLFEPLFGLSLALYAVCFELAQACDPTAESEWPLRVTGELPEPITLELAEEIAA